MTRVVVLLATALALGAAAQRSAAADEQRHVELMSKEEVMEMHANFARARELQTVPVGTVLNVGACVRRARQSAERRARLSRRCEERESGVPMRH